ncbi:hypothetical protein HX824_14840 [Pseudomonas sp. D4002]|nr:hypothetical protein [Pseudomonas sp. D4002]
MGWLAPVHAGRDDLREKSEGPFGGVFTGAQKQQNQHKAGFGGASYLEKSDGFIFEENSPLTLFLFFGAFPLDRYFLILGRRLSLDFRVCRWHKNVQCARYQQLAQDTQLLSGQKLMAKGSVKFESQVSSERV